MENRSLSLTSHNLFILLTTSRIPSLSKSVLSSTTIPAQSALTLLSIGQKILHTRTVFVPGAGDDLGAETGDVKNYFWKLESSQKN
jgi:hypothetical protein